MKSKLVRFSCYTKIFFNFHKSDRTNGITVRLESDRTNGITVRMESDRTNGIKVRLESNFYLE